MADEPFIPLARPLMDEREAQAAARAISSGWVTQGPQVAAFEREFADYVGARQACAVSNCTTALHLALRAVGVGPGDEVITVSHSFIATANSIRYCGAIPVFADIEPGTLNIDPQRLEEAIGERTRAILCVHQLGMPCNLRSIVELGQRHNVPVIEDAACAIGSEILWDGQWERIGRPRGEIACFSFHPRKVITTGDGGMIVTSNDQWDHRFRLWRQHGMSVPDTVRHSSTEVITESYLTVGYNYRLTDIQAAIGREQLKRLPEIVPRRRALAARYAALLTGTAGVTPADEPQWARSNWQSYWVSLAEHLDQHAVMQFLLDHGIASRRGVMCSHREPAYANEPWSCTSNSTRCTCTGGTCKRLSVSEQAQDRNVLLPLYADMTEAEQDRVCAVLSEACARLQMSGATSTRV
jgi:perosamine synthetase